MSNPYIWGPLTRTNADNTTIDEAVATAVGAHNDDPDAHLGADQALQSHRAAEIIDHLAQSVVNDKIAAPARAYIAVVGSGLAGDFTTVKDAVDFAMTTSGGTILILPGTYTVDDEISISPKINFYGIDTESCIIQRNVSGNAFMLYNDDTTSQRQSTWQNLTFRFTTVSTLIRRDPYTVDANSILRFVDCNVYDSPCFTYGRIYQLEFYRCTIDVASTNFAIGGADYAFYDSSFTWTAPSAGAVGFKQQTGDIFNSALRFVRTNANFQSVSNGPLLDGNYGVVSSVQESSLYMLRLSHANQSPRFIRSSTITLYTTQALTIGANASGCVYQASVFSGGAIPNIVSGSNGGSMIGCVYTGNPRVSSYPLVYTPSVGRPEKYTLAAAGTVVDASMGRTIQHTPTSSKTLTAINGVYGEILVLEIFTGASSYTMTFGSGFKDVGTLATGTTASRKFIITFVMTQSGYVQIARGAATTL